MPGRATAPDAGWSLLAPGSDPPGQLLRQLANLQLFSVVAGARTLAEAGRALYRSPAAVSRATHDLEAAVGTCLLERGGQGIRLSDAGRRVVRRARRIETEVVGAAGALVHVLGG